MQSQYNYIAFLTTSLLVTLTSQPSLAFRITPNQPNDSDGTYKYEERYKYEDGKGFTKLDAWPFPDPRRLLPGQVLEIKPGGTNDLLNLRNQQFGHAWEFIPKGNLNGSFNIENYYACGSDFPCEHKGIGKNNAVGAFFKLNYRPEGNDSCRPRPSLRYLR